MLSIKCYKACKCHLILHHVRNTRLLCMIRKDHAEANTKLATLIKKVLKVLSLNWFQVLQILYK